MILRGSLSGAGGFASPPLPPCLAAMATMGASAAGSRLPNTGSCATPTSFFTSGAGTPGPGDGDPAVHPHRTNKPTTSQGYMVFMASPFKRWQTGQDP